MTSLTSHVMYTCEGTMFTLSTDKIGPKVRRAGTSRGLYTPPNKNRGINGMTESEACAVSFIKMKKKNCRSLTFCFANVPKVERGLFEFIATHRGLRKW